MMKSTSVTSKQFSRKDASNIESKMDYQVIKDYFGQLEAIPFIFIMRKKDVSIKFFRNLLIVKFKCRFRNK